MHFYHLDPYILLVSKNAMTVCILKRRCNEVQQGHMAWTKCLGGTKSETETQGMWLRVGGLHLAPTFPMKLWGRDVCWTRASHRTCSGFQKRGHCSGIQASNGCSTCTWLLAPHTDSGLSSVTGCYFQSNQLIATALTHLPSLGLWTQVGLSG